MALPEDEVDAVVVFAVDEVVGTVLREDEIDAVVVGTVDRVGGVIRAVAREKAASTRRSASN